MKKIAAALFVLATLLSNVAFAQDCHPEEHKEHCDKH